MFSKPHLIDFKQIGESALGYISVTESAKNIPFEIKRVFWTYYTPESIVRGRHAHHKTEQVLVALNGRIIVNIESAQGMIEIFVLERPNVGLYVPPNVWHTMQYSHSAVQMVFASTEYDEKDYIRNYEDFKEIWKS
jgi:mannose-6-phosphate isomerase-like protein (cupin superfamily)